MAFGEARDAHAELREMFFDKGDEVGGVGKAALRGSPRSFSPMPACAWPWPL